MVSARTPGDLGRAMGSIDIDTSPLGRVQSFTRTVGRNVERNLGRIGRGAQAAARGIDTMEREILAVGASAGILTGIGLRVAGNFEQARIQVEGLVGSEQAAVKLMDDLRQQARRAGLPFQDMLNVATMLLPTFEGNTRELEKWFDLVRRTAALNPQEGLEGAAFSIREMISSGGTDLISLSERFNIGRAQFREALEESGGDMAAALDMVLSRMGITTETADRMGRTFNSSLTLARDAAVQLLREGFEPLAELLTPMLRDTAEWLHTLRETNPQVARMGAGVAAIAAAGAPALLVFNQLAQAAGRLRSLGILRQLGRLGRGGLYVAAGAAVGFAGARGAGAAMGHERLANYTPRQFMEDLRQQILEFAVWWDRTLTELSTTTTDRMAGFINGLAQGQRALGLWVQRLGEMIPARLGGRELQERGMRMGEGAMQMELIVHRMQQAVAELNAGRGRRVGQLAQRLYPFSQAQFDSGGGGGQAGGADDEFSREQQGVIFDWVQRRREIEEEANEARIQATQEYESQRTSIIRNHEQTIARDAEDFARQRARQQAQIERDIGRMQEDRLRREREAEAELNESIQEARQEHGERVADIEKDYRDQRERAEAQHRANILDAASRLDARALLQEQRRYAQQSEEAEEAHEERLGDEQEQLDDFVAQEREAHQERMQAARDAERRQITRMRESLAQQQAIEDEDRAIRLQRMQEDHEAQLQELRTQHGNRLSQIREQAADEREALDDEFQKELDNLGIYYQAQRDIQTTNQAAMLKFWEEWWEDMGEAMGWTGDRQQGPPTREEAERQQRRENQFPSLREAPLTAYQHGGAVGRTGPAMLHAGEYVLNPRVTQTLRDMMGGFSQEGLMHAMQGAGNRNVTLHVDEGGIQVTVAPGETMQAAQDIRSQLAELLRELADE